MTAAIRPLKAWVLILCVFAGLTFTSAHAQEDALSCPASPPTRLENGIDGRVTPGSANRIRATPDTDGEILGSIPGGAVFNVLYDAVCGDDYLWWRVAYQGIVGWTVEGIDDDYFLEPYQESEPISVYQVDGATGLVDGAGLSFTLPASLVTDVLFQPVVGPMNPEVMSPQPNFRRFSLRNEEDTAETPIWDTWGEILIYPVAEYEMLGDYFVDRLDTIQQLIADQPDLSVLEGSIAMLPACCSAQILHAQEAYLPFANGNGYRFVTYYSQMTGEINPQFFVYQFIGLTSDNAYLINAEFRIEVPASAAPYFNQVAFSVDSEPGSAYLKQYYGEWSANLNALGTDDFAPDLQVLDVLFASLRIEEAPAI